MKKFKNNFHCVLLYNLILFNFILLESSTKKISNFFFDKFIIANNNLFLTRAYGRLPTTDLTLTFKRFFLSFYFLKKIQKKILVTFLGNEEVIGILKPVFRSFKLNCYTRFNNFQRFPLYVSAKPILFLEHKFTSSESLAFLFRRFFLQHAINACIKPQHTILYRIFSTLDDYKKLIFLSLILVSFFKK